MRKLNKLLAGVSVAVLASFQAQATCVPADCNAMGYTKSASDCEGADMIKCPFNTNQVWCVEKPVDPEPGMILYSDGTVSNDLIADKTAVGIVAYVEGGKRLAIALEESRKYFSTGSEDVSCLTNYIDEAKVRADFNGTQNTSCMVNYKGSYDYPAAKYCNTYKPVSSGTGSSGWFLPSAGELYAISSNYTVINRRLKKFSNQLHADYSWYWSSSESGDFGDNSALGSRAWVVNLEKRSMTGSDFASYKDASDWPVRCMLAF